MIERDFCACIFDMDGTLIDSQLYWETLPSDMLKERGVVLSSEDSKTIRTMNIPQALAFLKEKYGIEDSLESLNTDLKRRINLIYSEKVKLKDGVKEYLEFLKKEKVPMCVATASDKSCAEGVLERLGVRDFFSFVITDGELGKSKTNPDIYLECARRLGSKPEKTAVFEDSFSYAKAARSAGFLVYAVWDESNKNNFGEFLSFADGRAHWQK